LNDDASKKKLISSYAHQVHDDPTGKHVIEKYSRRKHDDNNDMKRAPVHCDYRWEATFSQQLSILTERTFKQSRNDILSTVEIGQTLAMAAICCIVWFRVPFTEKSIFDRVSNVSINIFSFKFFF
jgi:hypothetical protein